MDKKKKIYLGVLVTSLIALVGGVSFAYISYTAKQTSTNTIGTSCVKVTLSDVTKPISLDYAYPLKDSEAEQLTPYTFKIENNCDTPVTYKVDLDVLNTEKPTPLTDLAIQVDNNTKRILNSLDNSDNLIENAYTAKEILGSGVLNVGSSIEHSIKIWLDESASNDSQNTTHNSKVVVTATQDTSLEVKNVMASFMNETVYLTYKTFGSEANVSCKYGLTENNLDQTGTNITKTSCELNPTNPNKTYYYEVCLTTNNGINKCIKDTVDTRIEEITTEPILNTDNIEIPITTSGNNITCKYSTEENTYTTEGIIEENKCKISPIEQGKTYYYQICSTNELGNTGCITGHQATEVPTLEINSVKPTKSNATIEFTTIGTEVTIECKYGTSASDLNLNGTVSGSTCTLSGLDSNTKYYYELIATNKYLGTTKQSGNISTESKSLYDNIELGDYVAYTPEKSNFEIGNDLTGMDTYNDEYTWSDIYKKIKNIGKQTINPSKLDLWRVIKINSNGTIETVSEGVSDDIAIWGKNGYLKYVGTLNKIASAFETVEVTVGSRSVGGTSEASTCSNLSTCGVTSGYTHTPDTKLILDVLGTLCTSDRGYYIASRFRYDRYYSRQISRKCDTESSTWLNSALYASETDKNTGNLLPMRPIVILKSGLTATEGSKDGKKLWTVN